MSAQSTTPVKVPRAAASYTPATQDADLRSQINTILLREGHITKIQDHLSHTLSTSNFPSAVQSHALALLRSGECTTLPTLLARIIEDVKEATEAVRQEKANGVKGSGFERSLAVPGAVVEEGVRVTRECLEGVCEVEG